MRYNFPEGIWVNNHTQLEDQVRYVVTEAQEAVQSTEDYTTDERIAEELWDVIHAAETALRILQKDHDITWVDDQRRAVVLKNARRGYYGDCCGRCVHYEENKCCFVPENPEACRQYQRWEQPGLFDEVDNG